MSDGIALSREDFPTLVETPAWQTFLSWTGAIIMAVIFLGAGLWKATDPINVAVKLYQLRVPQSLSVLTTVLLGIAEVVTGILLLIPRFRRWGALSSSILLIAFMVFIGIHYTELVGADCSCFPWLKRAVNPAFFAEDGAMLVLSIIAGVWARKAQGFRAATMILAAVAVLSLASYGYATTRHSGTKAPDTLTAQDGHAVAINKGKVFVYFFNPQCLHCLDAGRKLAALNWGDTKFVGVPTENPQFGSWFMGKAGLTDRGPVVKDLDALRKLFPFDLPPAGVALEDGYEKTMLLQFEDKEPQATLSKLGFAH